MAAMADEPMPKEYVKFERRGRVLSLMVYVTIASVVFLFGAAAQRFLVESPEPKWNPLGAYPSQDVLNAANEVPVGGTVEVLAKKCVVSKSSVTVYGHKGWQLVLPPGTHIPDGNGRAIRSPGCVNLHFQNPIPPLVAARAAQLCQATGQPSIWKIVGEETPHRKSGTGVPRSWETEPFKLACS